MYNDAMQEGQSTTQFIIVTGLSGSGKSGAIRCFEDLGFFCVDNLPAKLIPTFVELCTRKGDEIRNVALIIDIRERDFLHDFPPIYNKMKSEGYQFSILFLEASEDVLVRRFSETRRPHPLAFDRPVQQGIIEERHRLQLIRDMADIIIDTSGINIHELREHINRIYAPSSAGKPLIISIISFGYKYGIPFSSDILFDVRFLRNPYFVPEFREKTGREPEVREYVFNSPDAKEFMTRIEDLLDFLVPKFVQEGKTYLTVSIGCTGGKHRSVAIADSLEQHLMGQGIQARCKHRDIGRE
ncbi:MAG TPA: RNase adapter RapZ [Acidobacteriota bacterium]|nr:RNase adapter RapZ [Acidobacteriota bacterium]